MYKQNVLIVILLVTACVFAHTQLFTAIGEENGPTFKLTGEVIGMMTFGFADEEQSYAAGAGDMAPGFYYLDNAMNFASGKNGYYSSVNFSILFNPVPSIDVYMKLLALYRPGSPYLPLQLEDTSSKTFDSLAVDSAYGRVNIITGLGLEKPLDLWIKAGKFDSTSAHYNRVSNFGAESVLNTMKTMNRYSMQIDTAHSSDAYEALGFVFTTNMRLNEELSELFDDDISATIKHGISTGDTVIPLHLALRMKNFALPIGELSAELLYGYNAMHIYSGHSFGAGIGLVMPFLEDKLLIPIGAGAVFHEKNIDVFSRTSVVNDISPYGKLYTDSGYHGVNDINTTSLRQAFRVGIGAGVEYSDENFKTELNIGFSLNNIAHIYRDTLAIASASADMLVTWKNLYIGGGLFLGTLTDAAWYTRADIENSYDISNHVFRLAENIGYEIFAGLELNNARFVVGYNCNKGISMNNSLESIPEAQFKYQQKGTNKEDGLFERGGVFTRLTISW